MPEALVVAITNTDRHCDMPVPRTEVQEFSCARSSSQIPRRFKVPQNPWGLSTRRHLVP